MPRFESWFKGLKLLHLLDFQSLHWLASLSDLCLCCVKSFTIYSVKSQNLSLSLHILVQLSRNYRHRLKKVCSIFQSSTFDLSLWNHQSIHSMLPLSFSHVSYCTKYLAVFSTLNHASHSYCFLSQKGNFPTSKSREVSSGPLRSGFY